MILSASTIDRTGTVDVGDYTIVWQLRTRPLRSGFLIYDREVGGGQRQLQRRFVMTSSRRRRTRRR